MKTKYRKSKNRSRKIKKGGGLCEENLAKCESKIQDLNIEINRLRDELNDIRNLKDTLAKEIQEYRLNEQPRYTKEDIMRWKQEDRERL